MFTETTPDFSSFSWGKKDSSVHIGSPKESKESKSDALKPHKTHKTSRRRIVRACMRCRLRKTKCDGGKPCTRCTEADDVCEYMKCSKNASKEYSQDYVDRLLEQNDKYKVAMRILYANRRLSVQPDNIVIPSTESDDIPLVHEILDRLGMVTKDSDELSQSTDSHFEEPRITQATTTLSTVSVTSPSKSTFNSTFFDESYTSGIYEDPGTFFTETILTPLDTDMGLSVPFEAFSSVKNPAELGQFSSDFALSQDINTQYWDPLNILDSVMNNGYPADQSWNDMNGFHTSF